MPKAKRPDKSPSRAGQPARTERNKRNGIAAHERRVARCRVKAATLLGIPVEELVAQRQAAYQERKAARKERKRQQGQRQRGTRQASAPAVAEVAA
jgi:hypothetical protein